MRTKEYLEQEKSNIYYYDLVKKSIYDLYPLREDKRKITEYFNRYLFADARCRAYYKNENGDISEFKFELRDGEIKHNIAFQVRLEILGAILNDETFIYAYNIIVCGENMYSDCQVLKGYKTKTFNGDTQNIISEMIVKYKENYPKTNLFDFLIDEDNRNHYEKNAEDLNKNNIWWLKAFNTAYEVFDNLRVYAFTLSDAQRIVENIDTGDNELDSTVIRIIGYMTEKYSFDLAETQGVMLYLLSNIIKNNYINMYAQKVEDANDIDIKQQLEQVQLVNEQLENKVAELESRMRKGLNCSQQTKAFMFIFYALGVDFDIINKKDIAQFIHMFSGRNIRNILDRMNIDYENENDIKDLKLLSNIFKDILPGISEKISNNCSTYI